MDTTIQQERNEESTMQNVKVDITHTNRLSQRERATTQTEAQAFLQHVKQRYVDDAYLHLDVKRVKETRGGIDGLKWKALLVTNRGRFSAQQMGFGAFNSLHKTFDALDLQLRRLR
jgi:hypothetical protein